MLDQGGLHKIAYQDISIFDYKDSPKNKKVTIGILLDQSGSMQNGNRMEQAREVVIAIIEALKTIKGVDIVVYGHTGDCNSYHDLNMIPYIDKKAGHNNNELLAEANPINENLDGFAIRFISNRMLDTNPVNHDSLHALFVLTDGVPYAAGYHNEIAFNHTKDCVSEVIKKKQKFLAIGIDNAFDNKMGDNIFGKGNYVVIDNITSSIGILTKEIKKLFSK